MPPISREPIYGIGADTGGTNTVAVLIDFGPFDKRHFFATTSRKTPLTEIHGSGL